MSYPRLTVQKAQELADLLRKSSKPLEVHLDENEFVEFVPEEFLLLRLANSST